MASRLINVATSLSQFLNTLGGGRPDLTISATVYVNAMLGSKRASYMMKVIDKVYFLQESHCFNSWKNDLSHASYVFQVQRAILKSPIYEEIRKANGDNGR